MMMALQFNLPRRIDRNIPVPIILHHNIVDHDLSVKAHRYPVLDHFDFKVVPFANRSVGVDQRLARTGLIIVKPSGIHIVQRGIPDLHLRASAQINPAVAALLDLPVEKHLKITVIFGRAEMAALAVKVKNPISHAPMRAHLFIRLRLGRAELLGRHPRALLRIGDQTFPAG